MKFYLDEHVDPGLAELLEEEGFEVFHASNGVRGRSDSFHFEKALELGACVVTRDDDFLSLVSEKDSGPGVFYLTGFSRPEKVFEQLSEYFDEGLEDGFVIYI